MKIKEDPVEERLTSSSIQLLSKDDFLEPESPNEAKIEMQVNASRVDQQDNSQVDMNRNRNVKVNNKLISNTNTNSDNIPNANSIPNRNLNITLNPNPIQSSSSNQQVMTSTSNQQDNSSAPTPSNKEEIDPSIIELITCMRKELRLSDRWYRFKKIKHSFMGSECLEWMISSGKYRNHLECLKKLDQLLTLNFIEDSCCKDKSYIQNCGRVTIQRDGRAFLHKDVLIVGLKDYSRDSQRDNSNKIKNKTFIDNKTLWDNKVPLDNKNLTQNNKNVNLNSKTGLQNNTIKNQIKNPSNNNQFNKKQTNKPQFNKPNASKEGISFDDGNTLYRFTPKAPFFDKAPYLMLKSCPKRSDTALQRAMDCILGSFVADAACCGYQTIDNIQKILENSITSGKDLAFWCSDLKYKPYYSLRGYEARCLLNSCVNCTGLNFSSVASDTYYMLKQSKTELDPLAMAFIDKMENGAVWPLCGNSDPNADLLSKIPVLTSLFAGNPFLLQKIEKCIRVHQNNNEAIAVGIAAASLLEMILLGDTISNALAKTIKNNNNVPMVGNLELSKPIKYLSLSSSDFMRKCKPGAIGVFHVIIHILMTNKSFTEGIRSNILIGKDAHLRALFIGACYAAEQGWRNIPKEWKMQTKELNDIKDQATCLLELTQEHHRENFRTGTDVDIPLQVVGTTGVSDLFVKNSRSDIVFDYVQQYQQQYYQQQQQYQSQHPFQRQNQQQPQYQRRSQYRQQSQYQQQPPYPQQPQSNLELLHESISQQKDSSVTRRNSTSRSSFSGSHRISITSSSTPTSASNQVKTPPSLKQKISKVPSLDSTTTPQRKSDQSYFSQSSSPKSTSSQTSSRASSTCSSQASTSPYIISPSQPSYSSQLPSSDHPPFSFVSNPTKHEFPSDNNQELTYERNVFLIDVHGTESIRTACSKTNQYDDFTSTTPTSSREDSDFQFNTSNTLPTICSIATDVNEDPIALPIPQKTLDDRQYINENISGPAALLDLSDAIAMCCRTSTDVFKTAR